MTPSILHAQTSPQIAYLIAIYCPPRNYDLRCQTMFKRNLTVMVAEPFRLPHRNYDSPYYERALREQRLRTRIWLYQRSR